MKKLATIFLSVSMLCGAAFADDDRVLATFKGGEVKESQVMEQFKAAFDAQPAIKGKKFSELDKNLQETLVRGYINTKLIEEEAKNSGIESSKEFQNKINNVKNQMLQQEFVERKLSTAITDQKIDEEYKKLADSLKGKEEFKVNHILVETEALAKEVKKKLSKGGKFAALAKEFSKDEGSKANGGDIGYFMKGQLVPEFENKVSTMKVGEISDPVKTQFGWHIIKLVDKRAAKVPTKDEAMQSIKAKLSREELEKLFTELNSKADVKLNIETAPEANKAK